MTTVHQIFCETHAHSRHGLVAVKDVVDDGRYGPTDKPTMSVIRRRCSCHVLQKTMRGTRTLFDSFNSITLRLVFIELSALRGCVVSGDGAFAALTEAGRVVTWGV